jgi:hypothetical protein
VAIGTATPRLPGAQARKSHSCASALKPVGLARRTPEGADCLPPVMAWARRFAVEKNKVFLLPDFSGRIVRRTPQNGGNACSDRVSTILSLDVQWRLCCWYR